jgi:hypothetical protein
MEEVPAEEADSSSAGLEITRHLWKLKHHYHIHKILSLDSNAEQV